MELDNNEIFISYAWGEDYEKIINHIEQSLKKHKLNIIRDKSALGYKGSIKEFMEQIGKANCIIVVISDKYLKSPNCMFELVEIAEHKHIRNRIFPIVLTDADIYDPMKRIEYVKYWEIKKNDLADAIKRVDPANLQGIREDIDHYNRFRNEISGLITTLKDMNTLTPKMHQDTDFSKLYDAIVKRINNFSESNVAPLIKKNNIVVQLRKMAGTGPAQVTSSERHITFGRGGHNLVVINHPQISWEHGQMLLQEGIFRYRHLSRSNSTTIESLVNRSIQKLQPGENNDYPLFSKDLLIFGDRLATYIISYNMVDDGQEYVPTETLPLPSL